MFGPMIRNAAKTTTKTILKLSAAGALAGAAAPAFAQDAGLCGGIGENGQWLGGEEALSDISTAPSHIEQMALVLLQTEYVGLFNVTEPGEYRIEAQGRGGGDTVIDVYDANGDFVISDDDGGGEAASRAETFLNPGSYCVAMRSFDGTPLTGFVRAGRIDQEALTPGITSGGDGCDPTGAPALVLGQPLSNTWADNHIYSLTLTEPTSLSLTAENEDADPILTLYDPAGNWLAENDDYDGLNSRIDMATPLEAGTYCVALDLYGDENLPITVTASEYDPAAAQLALVNRGEAAPSLDGSHPVENLGELSTRLRDDVTISSGTAQWYSVDIFEAGLLLVEAIGEGESDPVLRVFDDLGREIGYNDDSFNSLDSLLTVRVQPGTYLIAAAQLGSDTTGLIRLVFERYVPARP